MTTRAQAFTLEAVIASLIMLGSLLFALQAAGVTALGPSTASPQVSNQLSGVATGTLDAAVANGTLVPTLRYWSGGPSGFHGAPTDEQYYVSESPPTAFGALLDRRLAARNVVYNVAVHYVATDGSIQERRLVRYGDPSDDAVRAATTVTLHDNDSLLAADGTPRNATLGNSSFYAPDAAPDSHVYNVVRVEVVAWRV
jgi:hypothetical protein